MNLCRKLVTKVTNTNLFVRSYLQRNLRLKTKYYIGSDDSSTSVVLKRCSLKHPNSVLLCEIAEQPKTESMCSIYTTLKVNLWAG